MPGALVYSDYDLNRQTPADIDLSANANGIYFIKILFRTKHTYGENLNTITNSFKSASG
jgi:hypothetical protein